MSSQDIVSGLRSIASALKDLRAEIGYLAVKSHQPDASQVEAVKEAAKEIISAPVFVQMTIRRVFDLDTSKQTFGTQLHVRMKWKMPPNEEPPTGLDAGWEPKWQPRFRVRRVMEEKAFTTVYHIRVEEDAEGTNVMWIESESDVLVNLYENLELASFPVDCQDLRISITSALTTAEVRWVPWEDGPVCKIQKELVALNDFQVIDEIPITFDMAVLHTEEDVCYLSADVKTSRKATYYMVNVAFVMLVIVSLSLTAWAVHPGDVNARHSVEFSLILTAVAFKLVLTSLLPPVSYVTLMDVYILFGFFFLSVVVIVQSMLPYQVLWLKDNSPLTLPPNSLDTEADLLEVDALAFRIFGGVWLGFNVLYFSVLCLHGRWTYKSYIKESYEADVTNKKRIDAISQAAKENGGMPPLEIYDS